MTLFRGSTGPDVASLETADADRGGVPVALVACGLGAAMLAGSLLGAKALWPTARITTSGMALARVQLAPFGERVTGAAVVIRSGRWVKASIDSGVVEPLDQLAAGSRVTVELTVRRAGWLGW